MKPYLGMYNDEEKTAQVGLGAQESTATKGIVRSVAYQGITLLYRRGRTDGLENL